MDPPRRDDDPVTGDLGPVSESNACGPSPVEQDLGDGSLGHHREVRVVPHRPEVGLG